MAKEKDPNAPVVVATALTEAEAGIIASALRDRGVEARVFDVVGSVLSIFGPALNQPIQIVVRRSEAERAVAILRDVRQESIDIDWSQVDTGEPLADERFGARSPRGVSIMLGLGLIILAMPLFMWMFRDPRIQTAPLFVITFAAVVVGAPLIFIALLAFLRFDK